MPRPKRWTELGVKDGFGQLKVLKWRYFVEYVHQHMAEHDTYVWRGHRCDDWALKSTLQRLVEKAKVGSAKRSDFTQNHLDKFQYAVRGRRGLNPRAISEENEWWALGQHHGLATPLLDWTASPFVAAYFAFIGSGTDQTTHRAVYALHRPSIEKKVRDLLRAEKQSRREKLEELEKAPEPKNHLAIAGLKLEPKPEFEFIRPRSDENQRLVNQSGLFTRATNGATIEDWVQKHFAGETGRYHLMKILIPNRDREVCLRILNRMNINHLTLFPDLYGASKFCNLFSEIDKY